MEPWSRSMGGSQKAMAMLAASSTSTLTWLTCIAAALFYSLMVFGKSKDNPEGWRPVFSRQNAQPLSAILLIHAVFLAAIVCSLRWAFHQFSFLNFDSDWVAPAHYRLTPAAGRFCLFAGLFFYGLSLLRVIERRWLFSDSGLNPLKSGSKTVEPEPVEDE